MGRPGEAPAGPARRNSGCRKQQPQTGIPERSGAKEKAPADFPQGPSFSQSDARFEREQSDTKIFEP